MQSLTVETVPVRNVRIGANRHPDAQLTVRRRRRSATDLTLQDLPRLLEAHELCERMGWNVARAVADRVAPK